jgi:tetratricopeptide (TPR) repeat protein
MTSLHLAAGWGNKDTVILLLRGGGDKTIPAAKVDGFPTPAQLAQRMGKADNVRVLDVWRHIGSTHSERLKWKSEVSATQSESTQQSAARSYGDSAVFLQLNLLAVKQKMKTAAVRKTCALAPILQSTSKSSGAETVIDGDIQQLSTLSKLSNLHRAAGRLDEAIQVQDQIVKTTKAHFGKEHIETAGAMNNYAQLLHGLGHSMKALDAFRESLRIIDAVNASTENGQEQFLEWQSVCLENIILSTHAAAIASRNILDVAHMYAQSESTLQRLLQVGEKLWGPENLRLVRVLMLMGKHYMMQAKYPEAERHLLRAHKITVQNLGTAHIRTAQALDKLGEMHFKSGNFDEAEAMFKQSLDVLLFLEDPRRHHLFNPYHEIQNKLNAHADSGEQAQGGISVGGAVQELPQDIEERLKPFNYSYSPDIMRAQNNLGTVTIAKAKHLKRVKRQAAAAKKTQINLIKEARDAESLHLKPIRSKT